eukprot:COSAG06_NODE_10292_length_1709_cov_2.639934_1_plen_39_part_10
MAEDLDRIATQFVDSWYLGGDQNNPEKNAKVGLCTPVPR